MQGEEQLVWETYFGGREYDPQFDKVARKFGPFFERVLGDKGGAEYREESGRITLHFRTIAEDAEMGGMIADAISQRPTDTLACMESARKGDVRFALCLGGNLYGRRAPHHARCLGRHQRRDARLLLALRRCPRLHGEPQGVGEAP